MEKNILIKHRYLNHIDGLRAVAVLLVLCFHFGLPGFEFGFLGVDVFFVISGFLVTKILWTELSASGEIKYFRFLIRRVRRILPSCLLVISLCFVYMLIYASPAKLGNFSGSAIASLLSFANIFFWFDAGYFSAESSTKPLLHFWSLGVEEQFYIFWPLLLSLVFKKFRENILIIITAMFFLSIILVPIFAGITTIPKVPETIFYLTPFRIFEFCVGGICFFSPNYFSEKKIELCFVTVFGVAAIASAFLIFRPEISVFAELIQQLIAVSLASYLICVDAKSLCGRALSTPYFVYVGRISFTLYLTHWPVWIIVVSELSPTYPILISFITTFFLSALIYRFYENPLRSNILYRKFGFPEKADLCVYVVTIVGLIGLASSILNGFHPRRDTQFSAIEILDGKSKRFENYNNICKIEELSAGECNSGPKKTLFIGNSHEPDAVNMFFGLNSEAAKSTFVKFGTLNKCNLKVEANELQTSKTNRCDKRVASLMMAIEKNLIKTVVYSSNKPFATNKEHHWKLLRKIGNRNKEIDFVILGGFLNFRKDCADYLNIHKVPNGCFTEENINFRPKHERRKLSDVFSVSNKVFFLDLFNTVCEGSAQTCPRGSSIEPVSYDKHHLSSDYAALIGRMLEKRYNEVIRNQIFRGQWDK